MFMCIMNLQGRRKLKVQYFLNLYDHQTRDFKEFLALKKTTLLRNTV